MTANGNVSILNRTNAASHTSLLANLHQNVLNDCVNSLMKHLVRVTLMPFHKAEGILLRVKLSSIRRGQCEIILCACAAMTTSGERMGNCKMQQAAMSAGGAATGRSAAAVAATSGGEYTAVGSKTAACVTHTGAAACVHMNMQSYGNTCGSTWNKFLILRQSA